MVDVKQTNNSVVRNKIAKRVYGDTYSYLCEQRRQIIDTLIKTGVRK